MNSKEALKRVKQAHYTAMACLGIEKPDIETEKAIGIIAKDLEVLEILKDNAVISKGEGRWKGIEVIDICIGSESTDGYNLIKEWLEKD